MCFLWRLHTVNKGSTDQKIGLFEDYRCHPSGSNCWLTKLLTKVGDKDFSLRDLVCCVCLSVLAPVSGPWCVCLCDFCRRVLQCVLVRVCVMRGCETASCLSVLGAGRHREGQTCVSMAMSGCSPFPMCWERGMNEIAFCTYTHMYTHAHTHTHTHTHTHRNK